MMSILLLIAFITAGVPCVFSFKKLRMEFKESTLFLFLVMAIYALLFLYGAVVWLSWNPIDDLAIKQIGSIIGSSAYAEDIFNTAMSAGTICICFLNLIFGYIIYKTKKPISFCILLMIVLLGGLSCIATLLTRESPVVYFFSLCCAIMAYFAYVLQLTYKEFCVLGNIYLQAAICMMSALAPLVMCLRQNVKRFNMSKTLFVVANTIIHGILFIIICKHYWMPLEDGFNLCFKELNQLASMTHTSYVFVNIVIFVILFVGDLIFNSVLYKIVQNKK